jgi:predicted RNA-binding protein with PIN domain
MLHIIDGYNLLFYLEFKAKSLREARAFVIDYVADVFKDRKEVCIVFDGKQEKGLGFSRVYSGLIEVLYTMDGMSADEYIIEWFQERKLHSPVLVYTLDTGLKRQLAEYKAKVVDFDSLCPKNALPPALAKTQFLSNPRYEKYLLESFTKKPPL